VLRLLTLSGGVLERRPIFGRRMGRLMLLDARCGSNVT
jgi:hypothetical protein